jgi:hypothetical protein
MKTVQWAPDGILNAVPGEVQSLLAEDGKTFGYAPDDGWSFTFYHPSGDVTVQPGQWVTRYDDGTITVSDDPRIEKVPEFPEVLFGNPSRESSGS